MKRGVWLAVATLAVAAGVTAYRFYGGVAAEVPVVNRVEVTRGPVVATVEATGTLEAVTTVQVGTQVSGTIKTLHVDFNSTVHRGQVVAELDPSLFETQVGQAEATLVRLQAELERARIQALDADVKLRRARELYGKQLIPANDLETAESTARVAEAAVKAADAQVAQARASLNQARVNLSHTIIRAPIDGVVIARNVDVGQTVAASMQAPTLYVLARDLAEMRVNANIDESDIGEIEAGQPVRFRVDAYPAETFVGRVSQVRLQPEVLQNVVSYVTVIDVPNPDLKLKPGMTASVTIETARADEVLRVPNAALRFRPTDEVFAALGLTPPGPAEADGADDLPADRGPGGSGPMASRREAMRERLERMSPEEREALRAQVRPEGRTPAAGQAAAWARGVVWVSEPERLRRVPVRTGITDGTQTAVLAGELEPGSQVVTGVVAGAATAEAITGSPLLPFGRRPRGGR